MLAQGGVMQAGPSPRCAASGGVLWPVASHPVAPLRLSAADADAGRAAGRPQIVQALGRMRRTACRRHAPVSTLAWSGAQQAATTEPSIHGVESVAAVSTAAEAPWPPDQQQGQPVPATPRSKIVPMDLLDSGIQLQERLKLTRSMEELSAVLNSVTRPLNPCELVLVCNQLARLCEPNSMKVRDWAEVQDAINAQLVLLGPDMDKLTMYENVVLLAALARTRCSPSRAWLQQFYERTQPHLSSCGPGFTTTLLRALPRLNLLLWELKDMPAMHTWVQTLLTTAQKRLWAYRADELVRMLEALVMLQWKPREDWMADVTLMLRKKLDLLDPPLLARALLAFTGLRVKPDPALLEALYQQVSSKLLMFDDADLATAAQAHRMLGRFSQPELFAKCLLEVAHKLPHFGPASLANLLSALGDMANHRHLQPLQHHQQHAQQPQSGLQQQQQQQQRQQLPTSGSGGSEDSHTAWGSPGWQAPSFTQAGSFHAVPPPAGSLHVSYAASQLGASLQGLTRAAPLEVPPSWPSPGRHDGSGADAGMESERGGSGSLRLAAHDQDLPWEQPPAPPSPYILQPRLPLTPVPGQSGAAPHAGGSAGLDDPGLDESLPGSTPRSARPAASLLARPVRASSILDARAGLTGASPEAVPAGAPGAPALSPPTPGAGDSSSAAPQHADSSQQPQVAASPVSPSLPASPQLHQPQALPAGAAPQRRAAVPGEGLVLPAAPQVPAQAPPTPAGSLWVLSSSSSPALQQGHQPVAMLRSGEHRRLPAPSQAWLNLVAVRVLECLPAMTPVQLVACLYGLARLRAPLGATAVESFLTALPQWKLSQLNTLNLIDLAQALDTLRYQPQCDAASTKWYRWLHDFMQLAARRVYTSKMICCMLTAVAGLPIQPSTSRLLQSLLLQARMHSPHKLRHTSPQHLVAVACAMRRMGWQPDFGFTHAFAQAVRFHWGDFHPAEYGPLLAGVAAMRPSALAMDRRWMSEMLLMVCCKLDHMDVPSLLEVVSAVAQLSSSYHTPSMPDAPLVSDRWLELVLGRLYGLRRRLRPVTAASLLSSLGTLAALGKNPTLAHAAGDSLGQLGSSQAAASTLGMPHPTLAVQQLGVAPVSLSAPAGDQQGAGVGSVGWQPAMPLPSLSSAAPAGLLPYPGAPDASRSRSPASVPAPPAGGARGSRSASPGPGPASVLPALLRHLWTQVQQGIQELSPSLGSALQDALGPLGLPALPTLGTLADAHACEQEVLAARQQAAAEQLERMRDEQIQARLRYGRRQAGYVSHRTSLIQGDDGPHGAGDTQPHHTSPQRRGMALAWTGSTRPASPPEVAAASQRRPGWGVSVREDDERGGRDMGPGPGTPEGVVMLDPSNQFRPLKVVVDARWPPQLLHERQQRQQRRYGLGMAGGSHREGSAHASTPVLPPGPAHSAAHTAAAGATPGADGAAGPQRRPGMSFVAAGQRPPYASPAALEDVSEGGGQSPLVVTGKHIHHAARVAARINKLAAAQASLRAQQSTWGVTSAGLPNTGRASQLSGNARDGAPSAAGGRTGRRKRGPREPGQAAAAEAQGVGEPGTSGQEGSGLSWEGRGRGAPAPLASQPSGRGSSVGHGDGSGGAHHLQGGLRPGSASPALPGSWDAAWGAGGPADGVGLARLAPCWPAHSVSNGLPETWHDAVGSGRELGAVHATGLAMSAPALADSSGEPGLQQPAAAQVPGSAPPAAPALHAASAALNCVGPAWCGPAQEVSPAAAQAVPVQWGPKQDAHLPGVAGLHMRVERTAAAAEPEPSLTSQSASRLSPAEPVHSLQGHASSSMPGEAPARLGGPGPDAAGTQQHLPGGPTPAPGSLGWQGRTSACAEQPGCQAALQLHVGPAVELLEAPGSDSSEAGELVLQRQRHAALR